MKKQKIIILMALTIMTATALAVPNTALAEVQYSTMINYIVEDGNQYVNLNELCHTLGINIKTNLGEIKIFVAGKTLKIQNSDKYIYVDGEYIIDKLNNNYFYDNEYYTYKTIIDSQGNKNYLVPKQVIEYLGFKFNDNELDIDKNQVINQYNQLKANFLNSLTEAEVNLK